MWPRDCSWLTPILEAGGVSVGGAEQDLTQKRGRAGRKGRFQLVYLNPRDVP